MSIIIAYLMVVDNTSKNIIYASSTKYLYPTSSFLFVICPFIFYRFKQHYYHFLIFPHYYPSLFSLFALFYYLVQFSINSTSTFVLNSSVFFLISKIISVSNRKSVFIRLYTIIYKYKSSSTFTCIKSGACYQSVAYNLRRLFISTILLSKFD